MSDLEVGKSYKLNTNSVAKITKINLSKDYGVIIAYEIKKFGKVQLTGCVSEKNFRKRIS